MDTSDVAYNHRQYIEHRLCYIKSYNQRPSVKERRIKYFKRIQQQLRIVTKVKNAIRYVFDLPLPTRDILGNDVLNPGEQAGFIGHHIDVNHILFIPKAIHKSIPHSVLTGCNMDKINTKAFAWLMGYPYDTTWPLPSLPVIDANHLQTENLKGGD